MVEFHKSAKSSEWRKSPAQILFKRNVGLASVAAGSGIEGNLSSKRSGQSIIGGGPVSSRSPVPSRVTSSVSCVSGVGSVPVSRSVASELVAGASRLGLSPHGPSRSPKRTLGGALDHIRRVAAAVKFKRQQQRLAHLAPVGPGQPASPTSSGLRGDGSIALRAVAFSRVTCSSRSVASVGVERPVGRVASVSSVGSVACPSLSPENECPMSVRPPFKEFVALRRVRLSVVPSVMSRQSQSQSVASMSRACASNPVSVVSEASVPVASVGEWRPLSSAVSSVLERVAIKVEASTGMRSTKAPLRTH